MDIPETQEQQPNAQPTTPHPDKPAALTLPYLDWIDAELKSRLAAWHIHVWLVGYNKSTPSLKVDMRDPDALPGLGQRIPIATFRSLRHWGHRSCELFVRALLADLESM